MPYLGNQPDDNYTTTTVDTFNGNNSDTQFTLSIAASTNDLEVFVENVQQQPTTAYSVSYKTLTFTSPPPTGTNNVYVIHRGAAITSPTPAADSIATAMIQDGAITQAKINSAVTFGAVGGGSDEVFYENDQTVTTNYTVTTNKNAMTAGPVTINSGVTVTVPTGSRWVVV